jgi:hypothetical protein
MGLIWDLIQHGQIQEARDHAQTLEDRVAALESQLRQTNSTLIDLLKALEVRFGQDLDGDGKQGY